MYCCQSLRRWNTGCVLIGRDVVVGSWFVFEITRNVSLLDWVRKGLIDKDLVVFESYGLKLLRREGLYVGYVGWTLSPRRRGET